MTTAMPIDQQARHERHAAWLFAAAFVGACGLFWWLPSVINRVVLDSFDPVADPILVISLISVAFFLIGFFLLAPRLPYLPASASWELDGCADWGYALALILALPALLLAVHFSVQNFGIEYGYGEGIPLLHQAVLYAHMFFCLLFLGASRDQAEQRGKLLLVIILLILPRLIISLSGGRFFVAQAIVPVALLLIARGLVRFNLAMIVKLVLVAMLIVFVPAASRGNQFFNLTDLYQFFSTGATLQIFQDNLDFDLSGHCEPLWISLTAKLIPWGGLQVCTIDLWGQQQMPATLERLLTLKEIGHFDGQVGTGSNYLLELFLFGGPLAILLGSLLLGWSSRFFIRGLAVSSIFAGIWAECLTRVLFAPRSNFGYVFERIPSLLLVTLAVAALAYLTHRRSPRLWPWKSA